ncbi:MAG: type II secretion system protein GspD [Phycisphaerales bacterium JB063]
MAAFVCAAGLGYAGQASAQGQGGNADEVEAADLFDAEAAGEGAVEGNDTGTFDIHVKDLDITQVLQLLSIQAERNIVASRDVSGKVSADLFDVDFYQALDMILLRNGYRWVEEGNFISVISEEDWEAEQEANRVMVTHVHRLSYLRAEDAARFVEALLSESGSIAASGSVEDGFEASMEDGGADNFSGHPTLVIRDYEDKVEEIVGTIALLDVRPKQVIIEATVLSASLTEANAFGVDFALFTDLGAMTTPLNAVDDLITGGLGGGSDRIGGVQSGVGNVASGDAGIKVGFASGDSAVFIRALDSVTDTTLIASPSITVLDRQRGHILVGQEVAYLSTTVTETSETQTVEFLEVGTQLNVRPFVAEDGSIRLELQPSVSDATIRNIGTTTAPDTETVSLITNVIVESGQTVVLGGLFVDDSTIDRSQVPGLGDVPWIGAAFQGQDDDVKRSEVIFLVKATVVESDTLIAMGDDARAQVDIAGVAQRERLLPWSKSKLTAQHMINARQLYDEAMAMPAGEERNQTLAESLYCVDMALHLDPSMVDALILKQEITGEQIYIYHDSVVARTFGSTLDEEMQSLGVPALPAEEVTPEAPEGAEDPIEQALINGEAEGGFDNGFENEADELAGVDVDQQWLDDFMNGEGQFEQAPAQDDSFLDEALEDELRTELEGQPENADDTEQQLAQASEDEATDAEEEFTFPSSRFSSIAWRTLSTAQLLKLAASAVDEDADQAEPTTEDDAVVEVNPDEAFEWDDVYYPGEE